MSVATQPWPWRDAASSARRRLAINRAALILTASVMFAFALEAAVFVPLGYLNRDEGWYVLSGKLVYDGQVPYRDFPYFQTPLGPYLFGAVSSFTSSPLLAGRIAAACLGFVSLAVVMRLGWRLNGVAVAALAAATLLLSPDFIIASTTARTEALVIPLALLALLVVLEQPRGIPGVALAPALLLVAAGVRLSFLPLAVVALVICYRRARPTRGEATAAAAMLLALLGLTLVPVILSPPHVAVFDIWTSQAARNTQFEQGAPNFASTIAQRTEFLSIPTDAFFVALLPMLFLVIFAVDRFRAGWRPGRIGFDGDPIATDLFIFAAAAACWLPFLGFNHQEARYAVPSFALGSVAAADVVVRSWRGMLGEPMRYLPALAAVLVLASAVFQIPTLTQDLDIHDMRQNDAVGAYLNSISDPDSQLITLNPALAVAAQRALPPPLVMGQFSFWPKSSSAVAASRGVVNVDLLEQEMADPRTQLVALDDYDLTLIARFRGEDPDAPPGASWPVKLFPVLGAQFQLVRTISHFGQFSDTLYILKRRSGAPPPRFGENARIAAVADRR